MKRPLSVIAAQVLLILYALIFSLIAIYGIAEPGLNEEGAIEAFIFCIGVVLVSFGSFVGLALRQAWARWLSVVFFVSMSAILVIFLVSQLPEHKADPVFGYVSWGLFGGLFTVPSIFLSVVFLRGSTAVSFFIRTSIEAVHRGPDPPPPPTFEF